LGTSTEKIGDIEQKRRALWGWEDTKNPKSDAQWVKREYGARKLTQLGGCGYRWAKQVGVSVGQRRKGRNL